MTVMEDLRRIEYLYKQIAVLLLEEARCTNCLDGE